MIETPQQGARRLAGGALRGGYAPQALHEYTDPQGQPLHWRIRLKHPASGEKWIRPMKLNGTGYVLGEPDYPEGNPLYALRELALRPDEPVFAAAWVGRPGSPMVSANGRRVCAGAPICA